MLIKLIFQIILLQLIIHSGRHGSSRQLIKLEHGREWSDCEAAGAVLHASEPAVTCAVATMDVGVEQLVPVPDTLDTNGNNSDNTTTAGSDNSQDHDNMEDNINEAASEDSGMSSVDNHNMSGEE